MFKSLFVLLFLTLSFGVNAQYYDTLPKGVRLVMGKYVQSQVSSSFNDTQSESPYSYKVEADIETLEKIDDPTVRDVLALFKPYPEAYNKISLGTHKMEANAEVKVNAYAFAYGITNRVSAYIGVPIYNAQVNIDYKKQKNSSQQEVAEILQNMYGDNWAQTLGNIVEKVYDIDGSTIQSGITNALGYQELGDWNAQGLGDIELGAMYNFFRRDNYGFMLTLGGVAPTGYVNDPDILQDIGFGDGQWDIFGEFGGGYRVNDDFAVNAWMRYTYQLPTEKEKRIPYNESVSISDEKGTFEEKLGNKWNWNVNTEYFVNDWFKFTPTYKYTYIEQAKYSSDNSRANELLARNTESSSHSIRLTGQFTSVRLFQQKKFIAPAQFNMSYQKMLDGKNTPKVDMIDLEFRMFF